MIVKRNSTANRMIRSHCKRALERNDLQNGRARGNVEVFNRVHDFDTNVESVNFSD